MRFLGSEASALRCLATPPERCIHFARIFAPWRTLLEETAVSPSEGLAVAHLEVGAEPRGRAAMFAMTRN